MPRGLIRYQKHNHLHFLTFSCHHRHPHLATRDARALFEHSLETIRRRYDFHVIGYVVMPEHVHLLLTEPTTCLLAKAIQALKLSVAVQRPERPFWQPRYYDFNVYTERKRLEKLRYLHRNPITRGLVQDPVAWPWSSFSHYATGTPGPVSINTPPPRVLHSLHSPTGAMSGASTNLTHHHKSVQK